MHAIKGAVLLLFTLLFGYSCGTERDYAALARLYASPYPTLTEYRLPQEVSEQVQPGLQAYQEGKYREVIQSLSQVPTSDSAHVTVQLYLGIALFDQGAYEPASKVLQQATQADDWHVYEPAQFYLALSLLAQGLPEAACTWLLPEGYPRATTYQPKAAELYPRMCQ